MIHKQFFLYQTIIAWRFHFHAICVCKYKDINEIKTKRVRREREESRDQWDKWDPRGRQEFQGPQDSWGSRVYRDPRGQQVSWAHKARRYTLLHVYGGGYLNRRDIMNIHTAIYRMNNLYIKQKCSNHPNGFLLGSSRSRRLSGDIRGEGTSGRWKLPMPKKMYT